jgi:hypothetical protein
MCCLTHQDGILIDVLHSIDLYKGGVNAMRQSYPPSMSPLLYGKVARGLRKTACADLGVFSLNYQAQSVNACCQSRAITDQHLCTLSNRTPK